jgi:hypothetical protein
VIVVSAKVRQPAVRDTIRRAHVTEALQQPFAVDQIVRIVQEAASK